MDQKMEVVDLTTNDTPAQGEPMSNIIEPISEPEPINEVEKFIRQLQHDRMLKIYVGQDTTKPPFHVPESVLVNSSSYFADVIKHQQQNVSEMSSLYFPDEGDVSLAWGVLLYWMINKRLAFSITGSGDMVRRGKHLLLFSQAWVLADKYLLPKLQNKIMMELMNHFEEHSLPFDANVVNNLLNISPVDTPLRRLLSEETVHIIYADEPNDFYPGKRMKPSELMASDGAKGLSGSLLEAFQTFSDGGKRIRRLRGAGDKKLKVYKKYLVKKKVKEVANRGETESAKAVDSSGDWKG
ncbi:hypothetical protein PRZ48_006218 [Zasmidium cellare]|uniref:BTB domain-containing protein n=1 Tax=Zasmidium cellare TaxID=395010 RepID=A0ABR0EMU4_ZASCE|nr:hypothetical protein PRZ48_006218 [Zasmidium cellare]